MSVFAVSKVRLDDESHIADVLWGVVDTKSNQWVSAEMEASVAEVVKAIRNGDQVFALFATPHGHVPGQQFVVINHDNGQETIALEGTPAPQRGISDMAKLDP
jgi:hypothetical protein